MVRNNAGVSTLNLYWALADRVVHDPERRAWFIDHGMPWDDEYLAPIDPRREAFPPDLLAYLDLPVGQSPPSIMLAGGFDLARWVRGDGWATYARYLATNPWATVTGEVPRLDPILDPSDRDLLPVTPRTFVPRGVFGYWATWIGASLALVAAAMHRRGLDRVLAVPLGAVALCVPWFYLISLGSGIEHPRHGITTAVTLRVAALVLILAGWERLTGGQPQDTPHRSSRRRPPADPKPVDVEPA